VSRSIDYFLPPILRSSDRSDKQGGACESSYIAAMAESISSGEESSEGEEEDESASPSVRGPTSPITAANRQTSGEKRALFSDSERGYLNSLSRQERRRIKREIIKGRKLGEIVISKLMHFSEQYYIIYRLFV
jgi:hypothetical protein